MKSLVSMLAICLMLNSFPRSVKGVDPEETFTNLCGRTFVTTVLSICKQFDREFLLPKKPPNVENPDNEDPFVAKSKRMYDGTQQFVLPRAQRSLNNDDSQNEKVPGNLNYQDSGTETEEDSNFDVKKFNKTEISEQCCQSTCNVRQMRRLCFW